MCIQHDMTNQNLCLTQIKFPAIESGILLSRATNHGFDHTQIITPRNHIISVPNFSLQQEKQNHIDIQNSLLFCILETMDVKNDAGAKDLSLREQIALRR